MAKKNNGLKVGHPDLVKAIGEACAKLCSRERGPKAGRTTRLEVAQALKGLVPQTTEQILAVMVGEIVRNDEVKGFTTCAGRNGGIYPTENVELVK